MSSYTTTAINTYSSNNTVIVTTIANMVSGLPIVFTGNVFGNITANATYYIGNIASSNQITLTSLPGGATYAVANGTGNMTATFSSAGQYVIDTVPPGDPLDVAFNKTNLNFDQIYAAGPVGSNIQIADNTIRTLNTNGNLVLAPNGIGNVISNVNIVPNQANVRNLGSPTRRWATIYAQYIDYQGGNITTDNLHVDGNIEVDGYVSVVGNVTGAYVLGNGALLTGINASSNKIFNGNSYANIANSTGNLEISIAGNRWTFDTTGNLTLPGNSTVSIQYANGSPFTGTQGTTGAQGTDGSNGTQGTTGTQGTDGTQGTTGAQGATGPSTAINATAVSTGTFYPVFVAAAGSNQTPSVRTTATAFSFNAATNVLTVTATSAQYADLAECYAADYDYAPGTVVVFGGANEVTISDVPSNPAVAGVVSTKPAHLMNAFQPGKNIVPVALVGRVPCQVSGKIAKGDRLVTGDIPGVAVRLDPNTYQPGCLIGKALQDHNSNAVGIIEVAVGRA
jgi:hypothetical protein